MQIDSTSYRSNNYDLRTGPIRAIVLHSGEGTRASDLFTLCDDTTGDRRVSAHYYVCKDGTIYQLVDDLYRAWHAGAPDGGSYLGISDWNSASIGVETQHAHGEPWVNAQLQSLAWLCRTKIQQYSIPRLNVIAHRWMAPSRKQDPSDFSDSDLHAWIDALYGTPYRVLYNGTYVRTAPSLTAPIAWNGACKLPAGQIVQISEVVEGESFKGSNQWLHWPAGGFVWAPQLQRVSA